MTSNGATLTRVACCVRKRTLEKMKVVAREAELGWHIDEISNSKSILDKLGADKPDCVVYELNKASVQDQSYISLCQGLSILNIPLALFTGLPHRTEVRRQVALAGYTKTFVLASDEEDLIAALDEIIHVSRVEEELRSANQRLAEMVEERARAMHESEEIYRFLLSASSDAVLVFEVDGAGENIVLQEINDIACRWFGYTRESASSLTLLQMFPFENAEEAANRMEGILKHREMYYETMMLKADGSKMPVELITRTFNLDSSRLRIVAVARRFERSAFGPGDKTNEDYRFLASQTGLLIYEGNLKTQKMIWGGAVIQVTGWTPQQLMRSGLKGWRERISSEDYPRVIATVNDAIRKMGRYQMEYRILHKSGDMRHIEDHGLVLPDESGSADRLVGTMKDITARVQSEEQRLRLENELQHSQRLESLGVLAGGIAHDFNNILAGIIGLTDLALREVPVDSFVHEDLTEVLQAANRAKELVRQILAFSRQSGQERSPIYLHIIAREVIKLLRASLPPTIEIIDSADVHSGVIMANAAQMYQIITNFSTNAAHAMANNSGKIEICVRDTFIDEKEAQRIAGLKPGPYVQLCVIDSGHGMAESVLARVFDPFFTTKGPGEGTGMGLAVVHGIITDHGGVVTAQSKLGAGSRFDVYLPRIAGVKVEESQLHEKVRGGNERILFIDDDIAVLRFAESALPRLGFNLTLCMNGEEGLNAFLQNPKAFDLVITDQVMPKMSGMELAKEIHSHEPAMPILLFTGFSDEILPETLAENGILEVVFKPIIIKDLIDSVRRVIDKAREFRLNR